ncbi:uncharacterized protein METZ01_LOCUS199104, partial [marine metagenome]
MRQQDVSKKQVQAVLEHWSRAGGCGIHMKIDFLGSK